MSEGNEFFEFEGNQYRRRADNPTREIDDVLSGNKWLPYRGKDALQPGVWGDEIGDPLAVPQSTMQVCEWEYFDHDGASFRKPKGQVGGVTQVLAGLSWKTYTGNRTNPALYGNRISDPLGARYSAGDPGKIVP